MNGSLWVLALFALVLGSLGLGATAHAQIPTAMTSTGLVRWSEPRALTAPGSTIRGTVQPVVLSDGRILAVATENRLSDGLYRWFLVAYVSDPGGLVREYVLDGPWSDSNREIGTRQVLPGALGTAGVVVVDRPAGSPTSSARVFFFNGTAWSGGASRSGSSNLKYLRNTASGFLLEEWTLRRFAAVDPHAEVVFSRLLPDGSWTEVTKQRFPIADGLFVEPWTTVLDTESPLGVGFAYWSTREQPQGDSWELTATSLRFDGNEWNRSDEVVTSVRAVEASLGSLTEDLSGLPTLVIRTFDGRTWRMASVARKVGDHWRMLDIPADVCPSSTFTNGQFLGNGDFLYRCLTYDPLERRTYVERGRHTSGAWAPPEVEAVPTSTLAPSGEWLDCWTLLGAKLPDDIECLRPRDTAIVGFIRHASLSPGRWIPAPTSTFALLATPNSTPIAFTHERGLSASNDSDQPVMYSTLRTAPPAPGTPPRNLRLTTLIKEPVIVKATWRTSIGTGDQTAFFEYRFRWNKTTWSKWTQTTTHEVSLTAPRKARSVSVSVRMANEGGSGPPSTKTLRLT